MILRKIWGKFSQNFGNNLRKKGTENFEILRKFRKSFKTEDFEKTLGEIFPAFWKNNLRKYVFENFKCQENFGNMQSNFPNLVGIT